VNKIVLTTSNNAEYGMVCLEMRETFEHDLVWLEEKRISLLSEVKINQQLNQMESKPKWLLPKFLFKELIKSEGWGI
jgi:hypothetical protein